MAAGDLTVLADVKSYLGIASTDTSADVVLGSLITAQSAWLQTQIRRTIALATYADLYEWNLSTEFGPMKRLGIKSFALRNTPVVSVTSVVVDTVALTAQPDVSSPGWAQNGDDLEIRGYDQLLYSLGIPWPTWFGARMVQITYSAGYAVTPPDVAQAVNELVGWRFRERARIGLSSQSAGGETTAFLSYAAPSSVNAVIDAYRRVNLR